MSELLLVRHAQACFGANDYDQLSRRGVEQSRLLGQYLAEQKIRFNHLVAGQMQRHIQTLNGIFEGLALAPPVDYRSHPGLNEYDFDSMVQCYSRLYPEDVLVRAARARPSDKKAFYKLLRRVLTAWSEDSFDGSTETWSQFRQRVLNARSMLQGLAEKGTRILVVSSGGAISLFIGSVLGLSPEKIFDLNLQIHNTSVSRFFFNRDRISLASFNGLPHLDRSQYADLVTYG